MILDGEKIKMVQDRLKVPVTGMLDDITIAAIKNFVLSSELPYSTYESEEVINEVLEHPEDFTSDASETVSALNIYQHYLSQNEYFHGPTLKEYIFLHHTAGWNNPKNQIDIWNNDSRGKLGTEYVIGGINISSKDTQYDGVVYQAFPSTGYAWHLGIGNTYMHRCSVGIELCNFGYVIERNGKFYTYTNREILPEYVVKLDREFRGYRYWHLYTDEQLVNLRKLLLKLGNEHGIDIRDGLVKALKSTKNFHSVFEYSDRYANGSVRGVLSHTNVNRGKFDVSPQPNLIEMLYTL